MSSQNELTKEDYDSYVKTLKPIEIDEGNSLEELMDEECLTGACPVR